MTAPHGSVPTELPEPPRRAGTRLADDRRAMVRVSALAAVAAATYAALAPLGGPVPAVGWSLIAVSVACTVGALVASLAGHTRPGAWLIIAGLWLPSAALLVVVGWAAPAAELLTVTVVLTALAAGWRAAAVLTSASAVLLAATAWLLPAGLDPVSAAHITRHRPLMDAELFLFGSLIALWWSWRTERAAREHERVLDNEQIAEAQLQGERERTQAIVESVLDIVVILDADGTIVFENAAVERVLGFTPGERVGQSILAHAHPDDVAVAGAVMAEVLADPEKLARLTLRFRHKAGGWRWLETFGRNLLHVPAIGGILGVGRDVTEQRELQARLEAGERLETVGRLAGGIAHDFNNLLTAILGNAELARDLPEAGGPMDRYLDGVIQAGERARDLTRKLLAFARREISQPVVIDLCERLADARELLPRLLGEDIALRVETGAGPLAVLMDPVQFEQIILNIAVNARDAMPAGGAFSIHARDVWVDAIDSSFVGAIAPGPAVCVTLSDSGQGMPPEVAARVFEPFFTTKESGRGTGLGLSTVYGSVVHAGGAIRVSSRVGDGTTFEMLLPRVEAAPTAGPVEARAPRSPLSASVLVAEDDAGVREFVTEVLRGAGCRVLEAADGLEGTAVADAHESRIDLLVTDVVMPNRDGLELAAHFRRTRPGCGVLFVTGYSADPTIEEQAARMGALVLLKPFTVDQLLGHVGRLLASGR